MWAAIIVATAAGSAWFSTSVLLLWEEDPAVAVGIALFGIPAALAITAMRSALTANEAS